MRSDLNLSKLVFLGDHEVLHVGKQSPLLAGARSNFFPGEHGSQRGFINEEQQCCAGSDCVVCVWTC